MGSQVRRDASGIIASLRAAEFDRRKLLLGAAATGVGASALATSLGHSGLKASAQVETAGMVTISQDQRQTWIRNFNFLVPGATFLWPSDNGIHEPLMIASRIRTEDQIIPWLATGYEYSEDNLTLTITTREGVLWSDGEPFSANDVAFTFNLVKDNAALGGAGAIRNILDNTASIEATDDTTVVFTFTEVYSPGLYDIIAQNIVPQHIWAEVEDPVTFTNENPVGTGPFTEIPIFDDNYFELRKNPNYWQADKVRIEGLRFPILGNNDTAQRMLVSGEIDWAGNFVPDIETVYVSQDPENHGYWFPSTGDTVHLYMNTTVAPFDNADVRKAVSMAINREDICSFAMYDYTTPADSTGLSGGYPSWKNDQYTGADWVKFDVDAANAMLDAAGLTMDGDVRMHNGEPMEYQLLVVNGWTDWVQSCDIISDNLAEIGITATVTPLEVTGWQARVQEGDFSLSIGWSSGGVTPFNFYRGIMSSQTRNDVGTNSGENWHRYANDEADALLDEFAATNDPAEQQRISGELQRVYSENAPAAPLFPGPQWYEYNATRFEGWPTEENPYAVPSTYSPERLVVMTTIAARETTEE
ncbi:MAG TPA: ABC transporter substrate-binding protein [Thermomicrobiales bacterium]|jgi:peptide/nickel transport system substrate-binding protein|nr:ABC transporter substrate-binding protein [Thermomicrobiales bacterium]